MRAALPLFASLLLTLSLAGCGKEIGERCQVSGDGFTRQDPCVEMCLDFAVTCPDGREVVPDECSGEVCGAGGACPAGQLCLQIDSFAENSRCVRQTVCAAD